MDKETKSTLKLQKSSFLEPKRFPCPQQTFLISSPLHSCGVQDLTLAKSSALGCRRLLKAMNGAPHPQPPTSASKAGQWCYQRQRLSVGVKC